MKDINARVHSNIKTNLAVSDDESNSDVEEVEVLSKDDVRGVLEIEGGH